MAKPTIVPTYATDATLSGGPQVGLSTRLSPGAATLAQGFWQGRRLPARAFAWLIGLVCDWIVYFSAHQIKNWRLERQDFFTTATDLPAGSYLEGGVGAIWVPDALPQKGSWYVYGCNSTAPSQAAFRMPRISAAGTLGTPNLRYWGATAVNADGSIMLAAGTDGTSGLFAIYKSTNRGTSWSAVTTSGATPGGTVGNLGYCAASGLFLASGSTSGHILTSPDGVAWTDRGVPASTPGAMYYIAFREGNGLLVARGFNGGFSTSSDGGLTWSAYVAPGALVAIDHVYGAGWGWRILCSDGSILSTADFVSYALKIVLSIGSKAKRINTDGQRFAVTCFDTTATPGPGIFYSDDGGTTWPFVRFSGSAEVDYLPWKIEYNGEQWISVGMPSAAGTNHFGFWATAKY